MRPSRPLEIDCVSEERGTIVTLRGSASMEVCEALSDALESACRGERRWLLIDMSEMDFICSLGLGALVTAYVRMTKHEGRFGVIGPAAKIRQLLDITRLGDIFPSFDSRESALSGKA